MIGAVLQDLASHKRKCHGFNCCCIMRQVNVEEPHHFEAYRA